MKTFLKNLLLGSWLVLSLSSCGETAGDTTQKEKKPFTKQPTDTSKISRADANVTDWTWYVGTDSTFVKIAPNDSLTITTVFHQGIPKKVEHFQLFIDSDNAEATGFSFGRDSWEVSGADYLVEDGDLYKSTSNSEWSWKYIGKFSRYQKTALANNVMQIEMSSSDKNITSLVDRDHVDQINITIEPFDEHWDGTYSTISTEHVKVDVKDNVLKDTMIVDPSKPTSVIDVYDKVPAGAKITHEDDAFVGAGKKVVQIHSAGMRNAFHFVGYEAKAKYNWESLPSHQYRHHVSWDGKFSEDFIVFIVLKFKTPDGKIHRNDLVYGPKADGYRGFTDSFLYMPLGESAKDGTWKHFQRNILQDLQTFYPGAKIDYDDNFSGLVNGFAIRGAGRVTNIKLSDH